MKKIKLLIASMIGAIALVFACVLGTRVNAAGAAAGTYEFDFNAASTNIVSDLNNSGITTTVSGQNFKTWSNNVTGNGVITNSTNSWKKGAKLNASGFIQFEVSSTWSAEIIVGTSAVNTEINFGIKEDGTAVNDKNVTASTDDHCYLKLDNITGNAGVIQFYKVSGSEFAIHEMKLIVDSQSFTDPVIITYSIGEGNSIKNSSITFERNTVINLSNLDIPTCGDSTKVFDCWKIADETVSFPYTVTNDVTFVAAYKDKEYTYSLNQNTMETLSAISSSLTNVFDTIFTLNPNVSVSTEKVNLPDGTTNDKSSKFISLPGKSFNKSNQPRTISFKAPENGIVTLWVKVGSDAIPTLYEGTDLTSASNNTIKEEFETNDNSSVQIVNFNVEKNHDYQIGSQSASCKFFKIEFVPKTIMVMQQEATKDANNNDLTIDNKPATYIRFIALVKGVTDINSSDFTFKIYREKDDVTQSITRSISTYKVLKYGGNTYSAILPTESSAHSFDGNYGTEFYAIFVIGLTNETYSGYKVYAGISYNGGAEQTTSGYTFA